MGKAACYGIPRGVSSPITKVDFHTPLAIQLAAPTYSGFPHHHRAHPPRTAASVHPAGGFPAGLLLLPGESVAHAAVTPWLLS